MTFPYPDDHRDLSDTVFQENKSVSENDEMEIWNENVANGNETENENATENGVSSQAYDQVAAAFLTILAQFALTKPCCGHQSSARHWLET